MMTPKEAALLLNTSTNTVRRWSERGLLRAFRIGERGDRRFLRREVESLLLELHRKAGDERLVGPKATGQ